MASGPSHMGVRGADEGAWVDKVEKVASLSWGHLNDASDITKDLEATNPIKTVKSRY